jgi:hypothetical protein
VRLINNLKLTDLTKTKFLIVLSTLLVFLGCTQNPVVNNNITLLSSSIDGQNLNSGLQNISVETTLEFVFSAALSPNDFESELSITSALGSPAFSINYSNSTSKAIIELSLDYETTYTIMVGSGPIGAQGEVLENPLSYIFTTVEDGIIRSMAPCTITGNCLRSVELEGNNGLGTFEFYSNYPIYEDNAEWENLTQAVFVIHGASHNADDYYSYLSNSLNAESLSESTVLISPFFRNTSTGSNDDFYWASVNYRDGDESSNTNKISSFKVMDELINRLANKTHFPVLERIVITGQSSGGRFTHVYAAANSVETTYPDITFDYIVSESQYFYYPDGQRINESSNTLYTPTGCAGYEIWPFGYSVTPPYLTGIPEPQFNERFVNRSIHYLLGGAGGVDGSLNTTACEATVLGSTRLQRGENMYRYMELVYPGTHNHAKTIVPGVTHNGSQIYQSTEFKALLIQLLQ